jgi:hypothetical protein
MFCASIIPTGDLALLIDTSHPMIHPEFERGLEWAKKIIQANGSFCLQVFRRSFDSNLTVRIPVANRVTLLNGDYNPVKSLFLSPQTLAGELIVERQHVWGLLSLNLFRPIKPII